MAKIKGKKKERKEKIKVECNDKNCPIHGTLSTRGIILEGTVASDKMDNDNKRNLLNKIFIKQIIDQGGVKSHPGEICRKWNHVGIFITSHCLPD